jgi:hypothetical protein
MESLAVEASMPTHEVSMSTDAKRSNSTATTTSATTTGWIMTGTLRRKVANRSLPLLLEAAEPVASPMPIDGDIRIAKKPRLEVPRLASPPTEKAASSTNISSTDAKETRRTITQWRTSNGESAWYHSISAEQGSIDWNTKIVSPAVEEAALPPADTDHMMPTPPNASAAGTPSCELTLENRVEMTIRAAKPTIQRKRKSGKGLRRKEEVAALAAMVAGIWAADQDNTTLQTHNGVNSCANATLLGTTGQTTISPGWNICRNHHVDKIIDQATRENSSEDDDTLMYVVEKDTDKNWDPVAPLARDRTKTPYTGKRNDALDSSIDRKTVRMGKWTADEVKKLEDAVEKHNGKNWDAISALVPGRTQKQCTNRWYHAMEPTVEGAPGRTDTWTAEDDHTLKDAVEKHGDENWDIITVLLPGRTKIQCWRRWHVAVNPKIDRTAPRTGRWTKDEDNKLKEAAEKYGAKNWDAIAALVPSRTRSQCAGRWHDALDPSIGHPVRTGKWTPDEDKMLQDAVEKHGGKNFEAVSLLVPGRTKKQCTNRWYNALDPSVERATGRMDTWTTDEDNKLKDAVEKHGEENWSAIAALVPGRTKTQCCSRWHDAVDPKIDRTAPRTGRWTTDEDNKLKEAAEKYGGQNWDAAAEAVPSRSTRQCRDRWRNALDPSVGMALARTGHWTEDEDIKLKDAVEKYGGKNWIAIAKLVPDRRSTQCWGRWNSFLDPSIDPLAGRTN